MLCHNVQHPVLTKGQIWHCLWPCPAIVSEVLFPTVKVNRSMTTTTKTFTPSSIPASNLMFTHRPFCFYFFTFFFFFYLSYCLSLSLSFQSYCSLNPIWLSALAVPAWAVVSSASFWFSSWMIPVNWVETVTFEFSVSCFEPFDPWLAGQNFGRFCSSYPVTECIFGVQGQR